MTLPKIDFSKKIDNYKTKAKKIREKLLSLRNDDTIDIEFKNDFLDYLLGDGVVENILVGDFNNLNTVISEVQSTNIEFNKNKCVSDQKDCTCEICEEYNKCNDFKAQILSI